jgi:hypothetical protein
MTFRPDPSFYPSPWLAGEAPIEKHAHVVAFDPRGALGKPGAEPDALTVVDLDPASPGDPRSRVATLPRRCVATGLSERRRGARLVQMRKAPRGAFYVLQ